MYQERYLGHGSNNLRIYLDKMKATTGIFFHYQDGDRLRDFPDALEGILSRDNVLYYDAFYPGKPPSSFDIEPVSLDEICAVHSRDMVDRIRRIPDFEGALLSASGTVAAAVSMWQGEIDNAFVFTGYGDHHAGRDSFGGGCYLNGAAIAIHHLRRRFGAKRFAIIDTDAHHGDGTWDIFGDDPDVLYMCFCSGGHYEMNNNINVQIPWRTSDGEYLKLVHDNFPPAVEDFKPQAIFWNWGYDGTQGDYGDMGLSPALHASLARQIKRIAEKVCRGRLIVVLCGGSRRDLARQIIPQVIRTLSE